MQGLEFCDDVLEEWNRRMDARRNNMHGFDASKKFYVGSNKVFGNTDNGRSWAKKTETEALSHARRVMEEHPDQEYCFIVKIVKVIRRQKQPLLVEKV